MCDDPGRRQAFICALLAVPGPVAIGVRADMYGHLGDHPELAHAVAANQVLLAAMSDAELERAVTEPARLAGLRLEPGLVELAVRDVSRAPGALPLLSHALRATWERRDGRTLTVEGYRETGGVASAIAQTADRLVASLPADQRHLTRSVFVRLTELGDGVADSCRRVTIEELVPEGVSPEVVQALLERLGETRLVTLGQGTAEVAHEVLIREWPTLRGWLDEDREGIRLHRQFGAAARLWDTGGRDSSDLYRGARLTAAADWAELHRAELNATECGFLDGSLEEADREHRAQLRTNRRLRGLLAGAIGLLVLAVLAGVVALIQRSQALSAQAAVNHDVALANSRGWASESAAQLTIDPERSILLAMAAVRKWPTAEALFALQRALDVSPLRRRLASLGPWRDWSGAGEFLDHSPDGRQIAEGSAIGIIQIFDAGSGRVERRIRIPGVWAIPDVAYSPNGALLAVATNRDVRILDVAAGRTLLVAQGTTGHDVGYLTFEAGNFVWSPDGSLVYFANGNQIVRWDVRRNRIRILAPGTIGAAGLYSGVYEVALSRDGRRLTVGGYPGIVVLDASNGRLLATAATNRTFSWLAPSPNGSLIAAAEGAAGAGLGNEGSIVLLDAHTLAPLRTVARVSGSWFTAVAFSPDGGRLAYSAGDGSAGVYSLRTGQQLVSLPGHTTAIGAIAFSPDGQDVVTSGADGTALIWRATGDERASIDAGGMNAVGAGNVYYISNLRLSSDRVTARFAPTRGSDRGRMVVQAFSLGGARAAAPLAIGPADPYHWYNLSPDGRLAGVAAAINGPAQRPPPMLIWDIAARRIVRTVNLQAQAYNPPVFSADDKQIAISVGVGSAVGYAYPSATMEIVNLANGRLLRLVGPVCDYFGWTSYAFSPDGSLLAAISGCGQLEVWSTSTGRRVGQLVSFGFVTNIGPVRFSLDDKQLAVADSTNDGQVTILDTATDQTVAVLTAHTRQVQDLAYSPDSTLLATASIDGTARIWDARTGQELRELDHPDAVNNVAFSPDGKSVATFDFDGTIRIWDACAACQNAGALLAIAEKRVTRQLTPYERQTFLR